MRTVILISAAALLLAGCRRTVTSPTEVVSIQAQALPLDPTASVWNSAPEHPAKLILQDLVEPRLMQSSTQEVRVRSIHSASQIAFRLNWTDATVNDLPGAGRFLDGCAVQIPHKIEPNPPEPQMGQAGHPVEITFWRADWQASVNGRKDTIQALFPNAAVDHYPFEAKSLEPGSQAQKEMEKRYAPAAAAGNRRAGPREFPVEDLVAEGPGTLAPAQTHASRGQGARTKDGWAVVILRPLPDGLSPKQRTQIAFAVWEGSAKEAGARKMRTGWIPLAVKEAQ
jgi:DMSO reductase family type II enzyme heme b subunit